MKRKICVRSMGLGAVIMLIGLAVGAIVSPPLIAQRNGVFDKITCRKLEVVDEDGNPAVGLSSSEEGNSVVVLDKQGEIAIGLSSSEERNDVLVSDKQGQGGINLSSLSVLGSYVTIYDDQGKESVVLSGTAAHNSLNVFNKKSGIPGINILSGEGANGVAILDQQGEIVIVLASNDKKNRVVVIDKTGKEMSLGD